VRVAEPGSDQSDQQLVADLVVQRLRAWGVRRLFGHAGDGINPASGALRRAGDGIGLVQAPDEEIAAFIAAWPAK